MITKHKSMKQLQEDSYLTSGNESYIEELYEAYLKDASQVDPKWHSYFDQLTKSGRRDVSHEDVRQYFEKLARQSKRSVSAVSQSGQDVRQEKVTDMTYAYRRLGHLQANIDPLGLYQGIYDASLDLAHYHFTDADMNASFNVDSLQAFSKPTATLKEIYQTLQQVYCGSIGFEYMHINRAEEVEWLQKRIEQDWKNFTLSRDEKLRILDRLVAADGIEKYLGNKYVGQKRFSLEGGDSFIPLLDTIVNTAARYGVKEMVFGMAHRGRLNVLVNVIGKDASEIFDAFEGKYDTGNYSGDVKYHLGYSSDVKTKNGSIHLTLAFNPSHLEIVSPVVQGSVRVRQRRRKDTTHDLVVPVQIHGDAAFAGQGVVMETFSMSQARWFTVGGSIHIVINNQVGFTISNTQDSRSTLYCTDVGKMVEAPIMHVNGNDPEAVYFAAKLAIDYRQKFKRDVIIDLVCYRRQGHNEADEPSATQPIMYKIIRDMPVPRILYAQKLAKEGMIDEQTEKQMSDAYRNALDSGKPVVETIKDTTAYEYAVKWKPYLGKSWKEKAETKLPLSKLKTLAKKLEELPNNFVVQPQVKKMLDTRKKMTEGEMPLNWGYAETLAYASLLDEQYPIRLCGQDAARGTFAHRHAVLHDQNTDNIYIPLSHLSPKQAQINIVDSLLSEEGVLAFEYGYAAADPSYLDIWEAQFGDFANGAQVVVDQFLSSGEQKWGRYCGLVMFLPHGYEGIGPEHSSARIERYLQLCAQENMQVCQPTTPAQIFHLLRRQMVRPYRKPLIVFTPKSLLRHPQAVSSLEDLSQGEFQLVIPEVENLTAKKIERVILCTGKVYYELMDKRRQLKLDNVVIIRIEQLYPFPDDVLAKVLKSYSQAKQVIWCQEEPENQGAWYGLRYQLVDFLAKGQTLSYAGRPAAASPAAGYYSVHEKEQKELLDKALVK
jgi:2-oxoglutarate dehydrogenase E1 component